MPKPKRKLTSAQRKAKRERKKNFQMIFINGKQKWVRREPLIDSLTVDEFIRRNADPIWLHQNELWEYIDAPAGEFMPSTGNGPASPNEMNESAGINRQEVADERAVQERASNPS